MSRTVDDLRPLFNRVCTAHYWVRDARGVRHVNAPIQSLEAHLASGPLIGVCPITPGADATMVALLDFDDHAPAAADPPVLSTLLLAYVEDAIAVAVNHGLRPTAVVSSSGQGVHLYFLWDVPQPAYAVRHQLRQVLAGCDLQSGTKGVHRGEVEVFPKQDKVPADGFGSMFVLPLGHGTHSRYLDGYHEPALRWHTSDAVPQPKAAVGAPTPPASDYACTPEHIGAVLAYVPNKGGRRDPEAVGYDAWFQVVCGIHDATGGSEAGLGLAVTWSAQSPKHDESFLRERVWPYIHSDREPKVSFLSVEHLARGNGWRPGTGFVDLEAVDAADEFAPPALEPVSKYLRPFGQFTADLESPVYVWDEVLQKGCLYALTARWGHGKTALMLSIVLHVAAGRTLAGRRVAQGRVMYLCGENPADVRLRVVAAVERFGFTAAERDALLARIWFTERPFALDDARVLSDFLIDAATAVPAGGFDLVVIDTGPAHSASQEENDNREMHMLAIAMRDLMAPLGNPACVALMHPAKDASRESLQPRGGGAFSGSIDGELCCWQDPKTPGAVELFHRTKFRGPGFQPIWWALERVEVAGMLTNFGAPVITVVAVPGAAPQAARALPRGIWPARVMDAIQELTGLSGRAVRQDELLEQCARAHPGRVPYALGRDVQRALAALLAGGYLADVDGAYTLA